MTAAITAFALAPADPTVQAANKARLTTLTGTVLPPTTMAVKALAEPQQEAHPQVFCQNKEGRLHWNFDVKGINFDLNALGHKGEHLKIEISRCAHVKKFKFELSKEPGVQWTAKGKLSFMRKKEKVNRCMGQALKNVGLWNVWPSDEVVRGVCAWP